MDETKQDMKVDEGRGYETSDVKPSVPIVSGIVLTVGLVVVIVAVAGMTFFLLNRAEERDAPLPRAAAAGQALSEPRLRTDMSGERKELRAYEERLLTRYRWVDRENKVVGIPVERAMEVIVERNASGKIEEMKNEK